MQFPRRMPVLVLGVLLALLLTAVLTAHAAVTPPSFEASLKPGESATVTKLDDDPGEIKPGQQTNWRNLANRVIAITTDSAFHNTGDSGPFPYPASTRDAVVNALKAARVKVISIKAPGSTTQMDDVATATGGS